MCLGGRISLYFGVIGALARGDTCSIGFAVGWKMENAGPGGGVLASGRPDHHPTRAGDPVAASDRNIGSASRSPKPTAGRRSKACCRATASPVSRPTVLGFLFLNGCELYPVTAIVDGALWFGLVHEDSDALISVEPEPDLPPAIGEFFMASGLRSWSLAHRRERASRRLWPAPV